VFNANGAPAAVTFPVPRTAPHAARQASPELKHAEKSTIKPPVGPPGRVVEITVDLTDDLTGGRQRSERSQKRRERVDVGLTVVTNVANANGAGGGRAEPSAPRVAVIVTEASIERIGPFDLGPPLSVD
jgi:hypothetical protein